MESRERPALTFALLDAKIEALPEGPVAALRSPRWTRGWTVAGVVGMVIGLSPSLLVHWLEPQPWMVTVAQGGLVLTIAGFLPGLLRDLLAITREFRRHRHGLIEQFDHDVAQFRELAKQLSAYPRAELASQVRYARMGHERLASRLGLMVGGFERLGLLPVLLSLFVLLRNWRDLLALPMWLSVLAIMAAILWLIARIGAEFRRRLQLYEFLLDEALRNSEMPAQKESL